MRMPRLICACCSHAALSDLSLMFCGRVLCARALRVCPAGAQAPCLTNNTALAAGLHCSHALAGRALCMHVLRELSTQLATFGLPCRPASRLPQPRLPMPMPPFSAMRATHLNQGFRLPVFFLRASPWVLNIGAKRQK